MEFLSLTHDKGSKKLEWFQIWHFYSRFPSDGAARKAVKGLIPFTLGVCARTQRGKSLSLLLNEGFETGELQYELHA